MTDAQLIAFINEWVYTNGNNEITAATLNPVLQAIRERQNDVTGNPDDLATSDSSNLVAAINEIFNLIGSEDANSVKLWVGTANPNITPPVSFSYADFYMMVDGDNYAVQLYQYDGFTWVEVDYSGSSGGSSLQEFYDAGSDNTTITDGVSNMLNLTPTLQFITSDILGSNSVVGFSVIDASGSTLQLTSEPNIGVPGSIISKLDLPNENGFGTNITSNGLFNQGVNEDGFSVSIGIDNLTDIRNHQRPDANGTYGVSVKVNGTDYPFNDDGSTDDIVVSGGGAVDSVNGQTGVVVLGASDVGADASGSAAAALSSANTYADGKVIDSIADSDTTHAPSRNAVFDALALKADASGNVATATALQTARTIGTITGDATSAGSSFNGTANNTNALTLATVNGNVGNFGNATNVSTVTVNAKGLVTAASNTPIQIAESQVTGLVSDLAAKQATLVSGTNIKTVGGTSLLGSGDVTEVQNSLSPSTTLAPSATAVNTGLATKQATIAGATGIAAIGTPYQQIQVNSAGTLLEYSSYPKKTATAGSGVTGLTEDVLYSVPITGGDFAAGNQMYASFAGSKAASPTGTTIFRIRVNTSNTLVGATQIAMWTSALANVSFNMERTFLFRAGNDLNVYPPTQSAVSDKATASNIARSSITLSPASNFWIFFTAQNNAVGDVTTGESYLVERK